MALKYKSMGRGRSICFVAVSFFYAFVLCFSVQSAFASRQLLFSHDEVQNEFIHWQDFGITEGSFRLWMDREVYSTLDRSGGAFVGAKQGSPGGFLDLILEKSGRPVSKERISLSPGKSVALDVDISGLSPGDYRLTARMGSGRGAEESVWGFRIEDEDEIKLKKAITLDASGGAAFIEKPFYTAVPFTKGHMWDLSNVRILDPSGKEIPGQFKILSRWDKYGSIRWAGVSFSGKPGRYILEYGEGVFGSASRHPIKNFETDESFVFDTGFLLVDIAKDRGHVFNSIVYDPEGMSNFDGILPLVDGSHGSGPYLVEDYRQQVFRAWNDESAKVSIKELGPEKAVVRVESRYISDEGEAIGRHVTYVYIYNNSGQIDIKQNWIKTVDSSQARYSDIGFYMGGGSEFKEAWFGIDAAESLEFLRTDAGSYLVQHSPEDFFIADVSSNRMIHGGNRSPGWAAAVKEGVIFGIGCEDFWERFPGEIAVEEGGIRFHLWPRHGFNKDIELTPFNLPHMNWLHHSKNLNFVVPPDFFTFDESTRTVTKHNIYRASLGNAIGHALSKHFRVVFLPEKEIPVQHAAAEISSLSNIPVTVVDPGAYADSGVFGDIGVRDIERFPDEEEFLDGLYRSEIRINRESGDYGQFIFGGMHDQYRHDLGRWNMQRAWHSHSREKEFVPWVLFARSGDPYYFYEAVRHARKVLNTYVHYTSDYWENEMKQLVTTRGYYEKYVGAYPGVRGVVPWWTGYSFSLNASTAFMLSYYYLTSDYWGLETTDKYWAGVKKHNPHIPFPSREGAGSLQAALDLYEHTHNREMIPYLHAFAERILETQEESGIFSSNWCNYTNWLANYNRLTGSASSAGAMISWADAFITDSGADITVNVGATVNILSAAYRLTGDTRYLSHGRGILAEEMHSVVRDPESRYKGFFLSPSTALGSWLKQGIPFLLSALGDQEEIPGITWSKRNYITAGETGTGARNIEALVKVEGDIKNFELAIVNSGTASGIPGTLEVFAPGGDKIFEKVYGNEVAGRGNWARVSIDAAAGPGVYRIRFTGGANFVLSVPLTDNLPEVYPFDAGVARRGDGPISPRRAFLLRGAEPVRIRVLPQYFDTPAFLLDGDGNMIDNKTSEEMPFIIEPEGGKKIMLLMNRYGWRGGNHKIRFEGGMTPRYFAAETGRLFDPEEK